MVFTQPPVEAVLRAHAATFPSVDIALGVEFQALEQDETGVRVHVVEVGVQREVTAKYVIACDGASSPVRQALGITFEDLVFDEPWMVIDVKVNPDGLAKLPHNAAQYCQPARPTTFIVGPGNHRRWEIMLLPGEDGRTMEQTDNVWRLLAPYITPDDGELWRASSYRFHALVASEWRRGRVFLAGDAAHQQPPFIGQGMCQGIRDVANLGWKLRSVLAGEAADSLLDTYAAERGRHVRTLTARIKAIGHAICERDPAAAHERDAKLIAQGGGRAPVVTRQEIVPPLEVGLLADTRHAANGTLFPQPWIMAEGGARRLDAMVGTGWRVVMDGRHPATTLEGATTITIGSHGLTEQDGIVAGWFDRHGCVGAVLRPDNYVYGVVTDPAEVGPMLVELWRRIGRPLLPSPP